MKALDVVLKMLALATLAVFLGIVAFKVRDPDLVIVCLIGVAAAAYDFFQPTRRGPSSV